MLVLGRKPGEYIIIDSKIKIEVVKSSKGDLRLAVDAPIEVEVVRGEIYEKNMENESYFKKKISKIFYKKV